MALKNGLCSYLRACTFNLKNQWRQSTQEGFGDKTKYPAVALKSSSWVTVFDRREGTNDTPPPYVIEYSLPLIFDKFVRQNRS